MKKVIMLGVLVAILSFSCNNENNEAEIPKAAAVVYKISELSNLASFAQPISKVGEIRKFILIKNDGTKLNFDLKSIDQTLFGKIRTFIGIVHVGKKEPEKAAMVLGENGFELFFIENNQNFMVKADKELDVGYKKTDYNFDNATREAFLALAKKKGFDGEIILNNLKKNITTSCYPIVIEQTNDYTLVNITENATKKGSIKGKGKCSSDLLANTSKLLYKKNATTGSKIYNIEIMYQEGTCDFTKGYFGLVLSLYTVPTYYGNLFYSVNVSQYSFPELNLNNINAFTDYVLAMNKVSSSDYQLDKLRLFCDAYSSKITGNVARCALYNTSWDEDVLGIAYVGSYSSSSYSTFIACDDSVNVLAHEAGHNLGADHVDNSEDVMYKYASSKLLHLDASNIAKMRSNLGF